MCIYLSSPSKCFSVLLCLYSDHFSGGFFFSFAIYIFTFYYCHRNNHIPLVEFSAWVFLEDALKCANLGGMRFASLWLPVYVACPNTVHSSVLTATPVRLIQARSAVGPYSTASKCQRCLLSNIFLAYYPIVTPKKHEEREN